ncbi:hypothetical protein NPIL_583081 [Nephila pilipes]|uniref:Secreted protein n=1 Tax=Nephila pilipes TaxID=299642 RepID=A0A8X6PBF5_NEPPI|nr:hypothetical protein NPIL_583081 [Nephila pilipes]
MVARLQFLVVQITVTVLHSITVFAAMSSSCSSSNGPLVFLLRHRVVYSLPPCSDNPFLKREGRYHANTTVFCKRTENLCSELRYLLSVSAICCRKHKSYGDVPW